MIAWNRHRAPSLDPHARRRAAFYALAVALPVVALFVRHGLTVSFGERPLLILFVFPIIASALLGGFGPGLTATLVAAAGTAYFIPPVHGFAIADGYDFFQWGALIAAGVLASLLSASLHRSRQRETARRRQLAATEDRLRQSEARFRAAFDRAAIGIALVAPDGRWLEVNPKLCEIVGYGREELLSLAFQDIAHPDDRETGLDRARRLLAGEIQTYALEKRYLRKSGGPAWVNLTVALVRKPDDAPDYLVAAVEDIGPRKRVEAALKQSEAALKEAQRLAGIGNWKWDVRADRHVWSEETYRLYGRDPALPPALYPEIRQYFAPESWARLAAAVETALAQGTTYECDAEVVRPDDDRRWIVVRGEAVRDAAGTVVELRGTVQDITDRKRAELALLATQSTALEEQNQARLAALNLMEDALAERTRAEAAIAALRESEQFKHDILNSMSAHIAVLDRDGAIVTVNQSWRCFALENGAESGQPAPRTDVGVNYLAICREASGESSEGAMAVHDGIRAVQEGRLPRFTLEYPCHSPTEQGWFNLVVTPLKTGSGGVVVAHAAITERKRTEMALERERRFLKTLVRTVPDLIWLKDTEGVYLACNPRFERLYGAKEADILGKTDHDFVDRELADLFREKDRAAIAAGKPSTNEEELTYADDGHRELVETVKTPMFDAEGRLVGVLGIARDITAARRIEAALRASEAMYRSLFDNMLNGFAHCRMLFENGRPLDFVYLGVNRAFEMLTGLRDVVGRKVTDVVPGIREADPELFEVYGRVAATGQPAQFEVFVKSLQAWFSIAVYSPQRDHFVAVFDVVTRRKRAERALLESKERLALALAAADQGTYDLNVQTGEAIVSPEYATLLGYDPERFKETNSAWAARLHPDDRGPTVETYRDYLAGRIPEYRVEFRQKTRSGEWKWILSRGKLVERDADGRPLRMLGTHTDITARKRAETKLRQLSLAVEQSTESIVITDLDGRIEYVNDAFVRATGYSREEVLGQNSRILQSGRTPPETFAALWATLTQGRSWKGEFVNRRKDGSEYVELAIVTPIHQPDGRITHYVAVKEDITEKKRLGEELDRHRHHLEELVERRTVQLAEARERAEAANRAKSAFLANMSHEIRTPLNAVLGLTHLLRRDGVAPEQTERLDKIDAAGRHLLAIVNDVLDLSKIEAGKLELEQADFHLSAVLDHVRSLIADAAKAKGLAVAVDGDDVPLWLRGDATRLRQALLNYAGNAVKFTERGTITLRAVLLEDVGGDLWVRFEVQDTGVGIPAEPLSRLFEAFEQADASTTRRHGGTGLGLAITRRLAALMGGAAGAESEPGQGSTFWFTARLLRGRGILPAAPAADVGDAETELRRRCAGARLLLAEDNPINREVALELLHAVHLAVDTAENGREAVDKARATPYALILMDVQMPVLDGLEATRAIRRLPGRETIPILAMTANAFAEDRRQCLAAGMSDFVAKPVDPAAFYAALLQWLPVTVPSVPPPARLAASALATDADAGERRRLAAIPGLDLARGLAVVRDNLPLYLRLLALFVEQQGHVAERLRERLRAGDPAEVQRLAHALKGSAGNLGATQVQTVADALQAAVRQDAGPDAIARHVETLAAALPPLLDGIRAALAERAPAPTAADATRLAAVLARLEALLEQGDMAANDLARAEEPLLRAAFSETGDALLRHVAAFDYEAALIALRARPECGPGRD